MSAGKRKGVPEDHEEHPDERWMASYMDMVTVLMCMFIVLFAMSSVDEEKFEALKNSLATGFGSAVEEGIDLSDGVVVPEALLTADGEGFTDIQLAIMEVNELQALRDQIDANLAASGLSHAVAMKIDERGLTIRLVGSETFFEPNRVDLVGVAPQVLDAVAPVLVNTAHEVSVEGHADLRQSAYPYPTNWELSSGRATSVLRRLVETGGLAPQRMAAVGYGSSRPVAAGSTPEELAQNRRVDIVVLSDKPEAVRALIPEVVEKHLTDPEAVPEESTDETASDHAEASTEKAKSEKKADKKETSEKSH